MRTYLLPLSILLVILGFGAPGYAQQVYAITVAVDLETFHDFKTLTDWIQAAPDGADMPLAISAPGTAAMTQIAAVASARVDQTHMLTLDTGTTVPFVEGDIMQITPFVPGDPATSGSTPVVVITKGQGLATTLDRMDISVPCTL